MAIGGKVWLGSLLFLLVLATSGYCANPAETPAASAGKYIGPGGCAASSCHGSVTPESTTRIFQNEYSIWVTQDRHAKAYSVLFNEVSKNMWEILNKDPEWVSRENPSQARAPYDSKKCLDCHALYVPQELQAQSFGKDDGVSCESCHGPASGWLGPHTVRDWPHQKSVQLGMYDTRNLIKRSEICLECHLGIARKYVDHEMLAAGHPDLTFELSYFTFYMPQHWKTPEQDHVWRRVKTWGVGQAVQLRESLYRLARRAEGPNWPEYAELDCFACHHSLTMAKDSWRLTYGYDGRRPGNTRWNDARVVVFRDLVEELHPDIAKRLNDELMKLAVLMNKLNGNRAEIAATATRAAPLADELAIQLEAQSYDPTLTLRLMRRIAGDYQAIAAGGERSAEQAAMALNDLYVAYTQNTKAMSPEVGALIDALIQTLQHNQSAYSAPQFSAEMQKVSNALGH